MQRDRRQTDRSCNLDLRYSHGNFSHRFSHRTRDSELITFILRGTLSSASLLLLLIGVPPAAADDIVARVGEKSISVEEVEFRAERLRKTGYQHLLVPDMEAKLQFLDGMIAQELLVLEGLRRGVGEDAVISADLARTERRALMNALYDSQALQGDYSSTESELREYFVEQRYDVEVLSRHIVCDSEEEALRVVARLQAGAPFGDLVAEHSLRNIQDRFGPEGWVGWFRVGELYEELQEPLATMPPGEFYAAPVRTSLGYHIFGLQARRPITFEGSFEFLQEQLRVRKRGADMEAYIERLRRQYHMRTDDDGLRLLSAIDAHDSTWAGPDQTLISWKGGRLSVAGFIDLVQAGRTRHPASMDSVTLGKEIDNQAGVLVMMAEARRLELDQLPLVRRKSEDRRREIFAKWLFQQEGRSGARHDTSTTNIRRFYDENIDLYTREDGGVTDFPKVSSSIRNLLKIQAETTAMDAFLDELRRRYAQDVSIDRQALERAFPDGFKNSPPDAKDRS